MAAAALGRREQNKLEKRGRIIAAARALFTHKGFDATTSQEIADAAGVASGTVFTYAKTKDDLLILVFHDEMMEVVVSAYAAARGGDGLLEQAIAFFNTLVAYHERDLPLAHALMRQLGYVGSAEQRVGPQPFRNLLPPPGQPAQRLFRPGAVRPGASNRPWTAAARIGLITRRRLAV